MNAGQAIILSIGIAAVMAIAGLKVARGVTTIGDLVLANGLILQLSGPLQVLFTPTMMCFPVREGVEFARKVGFLSFTVA